jgi:hypothetical protein
MVTIHLITKFPVGVKPMLISAIEIACQLALYFA